MIYDAYQSVTNFSDEPTAEGQDPLLVNCLPRDEDLQKMKEWCLYTIGKELAELNAELKKFGGAIKYLF